MPQRNKRGLAPGGSSGGGLASLLQMFLGSSVTPNANFGAAQAFAEDPGQYEALGYDRAEELLAAGDKPFVAKNWFARPNARQLNNEVALNKILGAQTNQQSLEFARGMLPISATGEQTSADIRNKAAMALQTFMTTEEGKRMFNQFLAAKGIDPSNQATLNEYNTVVSPTIAPSLAAANIAAQQAARKAGTQAQFDADSMIVNEPEIKNKANADALMASEEARFLQMNQPQLLKAKLKSALQQPDLESAGVQAQRWMGAAPGSTIFDRATGQSFGQAAPKQESPDMVNLLNAIRGGPGISPTGAPIGGTLPAAPQAQPTVNQFFYDPATGMMINRATGEKFRKVE